MPEVSVIVLSYNSSAYLPACLKALRLQTHHNFEVIVVDNGSNDASAEVAANWYPGLRLVRSATNTGYAAGCNLGFLHARGEYLVVIGPDCEPEPGWLEALVDACREPGVGLATSMVRHRDRPDLLNTCGNQVHLLGLGFCRGLDQPWQHFTIPSDVASISGCSFAMNRQMLERIGGFDESFFMYSEDTDLSLRAWLAGYRVVYVPSAVAYHRYRQDMRPSKFFLLERNRYLILLKILRWRTLAALLPGLLAGEVMMWVYAALRGPQFCTAKLRAIAWLATHSQLVRERRSTVARLRRVQDSDLLALMTGALPERQMLGGGLLGQILGRAGGGYFAFALALARRLTC